MTWGSGVTVLQRQASAERPGHSLVELLIGIFILTLICISWLKISAIQSSKRESFRREAVERLAGMMDAFTEYDFLTSVASQISGSAPVAWCFDENSLSFSSRSNRTNELYQMFAPVEIVRDGKTRKEEPTSIGYRLYTIRLLDFEKDKTARSKRYDGWAVASRAKIDNARLLVGELYERYGNMEASDRPFCRLKMFIGL